MELRVPVVLVCMCWWMFHCAFMSHFVCILLYVSLCVLFCVYHCVWLRVSLCVSCVCHCELCVSLSVLCVCVIVYVIMCVIVFYCVLLSFIVYVCVSLSAYHCRCYCVWQSQCEEKKVKKKMKCIKKASINSIYRKSIFTIRLKINSKIHNWRNTINCL